MDIVYTLNEYGNPYFNRGDRGRHSDFFRIHMDAEDAVLEALIPILDSHPLDEATAIVCYIVGSDNPMFSGYFSTRNGANTMMAQARQDSRLKDSLELESAARYAQEVARETLLEQVKDYLDNLNVYEALAISCYMSAYMTNIFAGYLLKRQLEEGKKLRAASLKVNMFGKEQEDVHT